MQQHHRAMRSGISQHNASNMIRLQHSETRELLHLSAEGLTSNVNHSWFGTKKQARKLRDLWNAKNKDAPWPFVAVRPEDVA